MSVKYLIFGDGYMGNRFNSFLEDSVLSKKRIYCAKDVKEEIERFEPEVVINCIGRTGTPNIDWCEEHKIGTITANITVPILMLEACEESGVSMVHLSSGCIYHGDNNGKGFSENDEPNFFGSFYSRTKIYAERILKEFDVLQLRLRIPMDVYPHPKNIIDKITTYKRIINIPNSLTYVPDFLEIAKKIMGMNVKGIYNVVNKGVTTYPEILELYKKIIDKNFKYSIIALDEFKKTVKAERSNCVLSVRKLEEHGINVRTIQEVVFECLQKYKNNMEMSR